MKLTDQIFDILGIFKGAKRTVYARECKLIEKLLESETKYEHAREEIAYLLRVQQTDEGLASIVKMLLATKPSKYNRSPKKGNSCLSKRMGRTPSISPKPFEIEPLQAPFDCLDVATKVQEIIDYLNPL